MIKTTTVLKDAVEAYSLMQDQINIDIVDAGTSWATALSQLLTSLDDMMRGHIADSISLISILEDVYLKHVNYLATGLSTQMQDCDSLTAEAHVIAIRARSMVISSTEVGRLQKLRERLQYLNITLIDFDSMLDAEVLKSSHQRHYFPHRLRSANCSSTFRDAKDLLGKVMKWLDSFIPEVSNVVSSFDTSIFANMTELRSSMTSLSECLMSYENELDNFKNELFVQKSTFKAAFKYEPPTTSLLKFATYGRVLESIAGNYTANLISKYQLAKDLDTKGSEMKTTVDQLYSDIELTLFTEITDLIDQQETSMVSFYSDLLQRVASLQRYLFANDTKLEEFMRRLSIWRMPIINFQEAQVFKLRSCCRIAPVVIFYDCANAQDSEK